jgi:hypothetical protein
VSFDDRGQHEPEEEEEGSAQADQCAEAVETSQHHYG